MRIAVVGAGKMGLPLAAFMASRDLTVAVCDIDENLVNEINAGRCPIDEPGLPEIITKGVANGDLVATTDTVEAICQADAVVIIVPALIDDQYEIDLSVLESVTEQVAEALHPGLLICYETTVSVGTVRNVFIPLLEQSGLKCGQDFHVCFSPERVKSRMVLQRLSETPKVVGGFNAESCQLGEEFYSKALGAEVLGVGTLEAAEFTKLVGMLYRDVNIALVNQISRYAETIGMDLGRIIPAANTNGEAHLLYPGIGVGGHCAPVYPWFIIQDAQRHGVDLTLARNSRQLNDGQSEHVVTRLAGEMNGLQGKRVLILGLAFRPQVKEPAFSPAFLVRDALVKKEAEVYLHDHHFSDQEIADFGFRAGQLDSADGWDAIILVTGHRRYREMDFSSMAAKGLKAVADGRNLWDPEKVRNAGLIYLGIGR
ncbi:MAG: nucleotide sugar dehydrogenase [bacterium]|nr:nucleotide sugar dehydrogenase [bacterium]